MYSFKDAFQCYNHLFQVKHRVDSNALYNCRSIDALLSSESAVNNCELYCAYTYGFILCVASSRREIQALR